MYLFFRDAFDSEEVFHFFFCNNFYCNFCNRVREEAFFFHLLLSADAFAISGHAFLGDGDSMGIFVLPFIIFFEMASNDGKRPAVDSVECDGVGIAHSAGVAFELPEGHGGMYALISWVLGCTPKKKMLRRLDIGMEFRLWLETMHAETAARLLAGHILESVKSGNRAFQIWPGSDGDGIEKALARYPYMREAVIQVVVNGEEGPDFRKRASKSFSAGRNFHVECWYTLLNGPEGVYPRIRVMMSLRSENYFNKSQFSDQDYSALYYELLEGLRHELEHMAEFENQMPKLKKVKQEKNALKYFTSPHEVRAYVSGIYLLAKKQRRPFGDVMEEYLKTLASRTNLGAAAIEEIKIKWSDYAMQRFPDAR